VTANWSVCAKITGSALIFVVGARQRAEGRREEGFNLLTFVDIPSFFLPTYLPSVSSIGHDGI
jgi:hypothetical protein